MQVTVGQLIPAFGVGVLAFCFLSRFWVSAILTVCCVRWEVGMGGNSKFQGHSVHLKFWMYRYSSLFNFSVKKPWNRNETVRFCLSVMKIFFPFFITEIGIVLNIISTVLTIIQIIFQIKSSCFDVVCWKQALFMQCFTLNSHHEEQIAEQLKVEFSCRKVQLSTCL